MNITFDKSTSKVTGSGRNALPFEFTINNISGLETLQKSADYVVSEPKTITEIVDGQEVTKQLYLLMQPDKEVITQLAKQIETTELTETPIMITETIQTPMLDENGQHNFYYPTYTVNEQTGTTIDEEGNETPVYEDVTYTSDTPLYLYTTEIVEVQKELDGQPLYWTDVVEDEISYEPQSPLEITLDDPNYIDGLEMAMIDVNKTRTVKFEDEMEQFNYNDVVAHKERLIVKDTFYSTAKLIEQMDTSLFVDINADLAYDNISFPPGGSVVAKITLPKLSKLAGLKTETSVDGLTYKVGSTTLDLQLLDANDERLFSTDVSEIYLQIENPTTKRIDLFSICLFV
jgi:hypothetical protein